MKLNELIEKLKKIKESGFIITHRADDTGVGKTLEDLLEIKENNLRLPDVGEIELKAKRIGSESMLTLATKSPEPKGINKKLFEIYKYKDKFGGYCLHSTIYGSRINPQGFKIKFSQNRLTLLNRKNLEVYWPLNIFDNVLKSKSEKIFLVFADTKGKRKTKNEKFHYIEAYLLSNLNKDKIRSAIKND